MSCLTLMIIDCSDEFRLALEQELQKSYIIHHFRDGQAALDAALSIRPDVIVLDLMLTGIDGITLLHSLRDAGIHPMVLAVTRLYNDYIVETALELGVQYLIRKPCIPSAVAERVRDLSKCLNSKPEKISDPSVFITELLNKMGFSARHKGYDYLREAAILMWKQPGSSITKELYPAVANMYSGTPVQVERAIRSALNAAWELRSGDVWDEFSPRNLDGTAQRPSNGYLVARLADLLRQELGVHD